MRTTLARSRARFTAKRAFPVALACLAAFLVAALSGCASDQKESESTEEEQSSTTDQPNIIFVLTDDLDFASTRKMPQISSLLADQGASFKEAFVSHSVCCPSRSTILTGLYDHNHHVLGNEPPAGALQISCSPRAPRRGISGSLRPEARCPVRGGCDRRGR